MPTSSFNGQQESKKNRAVNQKKRASDWDDLHSCSSAYKCNATETFGAFRIAIRNSLCSMVQQDAQLFHSMALKERAKRKKEKRECVRDDLPAKCI